MTSREANRDGVSGSFLQAKRAGNSVPVGFKTPSLLAEKISSLLLALARKGVKIIIIILKKGENGYGNKENKKWK